MYWYKHSMFHRQAPWPRWILPFSPGSSSLRLPNFERQGEGFCMSSSLSLESDMAPSSNASVVHLKLMRDVRRKKHYQCDLNRHLMVGTNRLTWKLRTFGVVFHGSSFNFKVHLFNSFGLCFFQKRCEPMLDMAPSSPFHPDIPSDVTLGIHDRLIYPDIAGTVLVDFSGYDVLPDRGQFMQSTYNLSDKILRKCVYIYIHIIYIYTYLYIYACKWNMPPVIKYLWHFRCRGPCPRLGSFSGAIPWGMAWCETGDTPRDVLRARLMTWAHHQTIWWMWIHTCIHIKGYIYILCMCLYMYICIYVYMYICIYVYMYICIYVYVYIYMYVYIYIFIWMWILGCWLGHSNIPNVS